MTDDSNKSIPKQIFSMKDLHCKSVVIFRDRAEVKRLLKATLKKGENEINLNNLANVFDHDSVRVEGHGDASVLDVVCQEKSVEKVDANKHEKVKELETEIKSLEEKLQTTNSKIERLDKQANVLNEFAKTLSKPTPPSNEKAVSLPSSKENVENFMSFLNLYTGRLEEVDTEKMKLQKEQTKLNEQLNVARENLNRLSAWNYNYSTYN
jgi:uncharacterized protein (TIGR02231 family)